MYDSVVSHGNDCEGHGKSIAVLIHMAHILGTENGSMKVYHTIVLCSEVGFIYFQIGFKNPVLISKKSWT